MDCNGFHVQSNKFAALSYFNFFLLFKGKKTRFQRKDVGTRCVSMT